MPTGLACANRKGIQQAQYWARSCVGLARAAAGVPLLHHVAAVVDGMAEPLVDPVVYHAQVLHQLLLAVAPEQPLLLQQSHEMVGAHLARVHLPKQDQESVELLSQIVIEGFGEGSCYHVKQAPALMPQLLPRNLVLALIDDVVGRVGLLLLHFLLAHLPEIDELQRPYVFQVKPTILDVPVVGSEHFENQDGTDDKSKGQYCQILQVVVLMLYALGELAQTFLLALVLLRHLVVVSHFSILRYHCYRLWWHSKMRATGIVIIQYICDIIPYPMDRLKQLSLSVEPINANLFKHVQMAPPDPILGTAVAFQKDTSKDKINLGIGAYRDGDGKPYVFKAVQEAEQIISKGNFNKEYLPIEGSAPFCTGARRLLLGDCPAVKEGRVATTQSISGTGALYIGFEFMKHYLPRFVYIPDPTWLNHKNIIEDCGLKWIEYPYFNSKTLGSNIPAMLKFLENAIAGSVVLLHACAHNPTGVDPTEEQWKQICQVMKKNSLIPYFDSAYQGFATGDLEKDAWPIRYFLEQGFQMIITQSFAKNMGLYGQRVGALHIVTSDKDTCDKVLSQLKIIIRKKYSNPPLHGALIAQTILNDPKLFESWRSELRDTVAKRIIQMRKSLRSELESLGTPGTWNHITDQIGMFSYTGLSTKQCEILIEKFHIYLLKSGRISMAGVNANNVKYLAQAIKSAIAEAPSK